MKKIFGLIAAMVLVMGCDDGEMSFNTFDFEDGAPATCSESNIYYKINSTEVLILDLSGNPLQNVVTENEDGIEEPRVITIGGTNTITYRNYDSAPNASSICSFPAPASPGVMEEWSGEGTIEVITDEIRNTNNILTGYSHKITLRDVSFTKDGETTRIVDNEFGSVIVPIGISFDFGTEEADLILSPCDENNLVFKRKSNEALVLNFDEARFPDETGTSGPIDVATLTDEGILLLKYSGSINDTHICDVISPISPALTERWEATSGTITVTTVTASGGIGLNHEIRFTNMTFTKVSDASGQTFKISDLVLQDPEAPAGEYYFGYLPQQ